MKRLNSYIKLWIIPFLCLSCSEDKNSKKEIPDEGSVNFILIYTDDHGYSDLSCQGVKTDIRTPNIDKLAEKGIRMESGYTTAPQCVPSRGGIITGRFQAKFGLEDNSSDLAGFNQQVTIAERLHEAGYVTGMAGKWHLGPTDEIFNHGFEYVFYKNSNANGKTNFNFYGEKIPWSTEQTGLYHIDACTEAACAFIRKQKDNPFFFYLAYRAPHVPLDATEKYLSRFPGEMPERRRKALAMISAVDDGVGAILKTLEENGIHKKTLIFFIGDNGAPLKILKLDEPGNGAGWDGSLNDPLNGEKGTLIEGGMRTPFLVSWDGTLPAGVVYKNPVSSLDFAATASAMAGLPHDKSLDGVNLIPYLTGEIEQPPHEKLCWRWISQSAIRMGDWKLLRGGDREYLYHLATDVEEKNNLILQNPEKAAQLKKELMDWCSELQPPGLQIRDMAETWNDYFDFYLEGIPYKGQTNLKKIQ